VRALSSIAPAALLVLRAARRTGSILREAVLLAGFVAAIEFAGPLARIDAVDLVVLAGAVLLGILLAQAARAGWLPGTSIVAARLAERGRTLLRTVSPRYAVALRPSESARPLRDRALLVPILVISASAVGFLALGERLLGGPSSFGLLWFVKTQVSYTVYLAIVAALWSVFLLTMVLAARVVAQGLLEAGRARPQASLHGRVVLLMALWLVGLAVLVMVPGVVALLLLLALGLARGRVLRGVPTRNYLFCRRDGQGRARAVPVHEYLRRVHAGLLALLALVVVLGQAQRLWPDFTAGDSPWLGRGPESPFAFTAWFGILATLSALLLVARAGAQFRQLLGGRVPPEMPLTPTLWIRTPRGAPGAPDSTDATDEWDHTDAWYRMARENGWLVLREPTVPEHEYDLVMGSDGDPRRFVPRPPTSEADARFQLERRLHVVLRRRFHRHFRRLFKQLKGQTFSRGSGFLFCPHVWIVPGVVRDVEPTENDDTGEGGSMSAAFYGPPYASSFPNRVRRYIGSVLRELEVDIIFWEDAVTWQDLRRVLGVAYEIHDQGRAPLLGRHFTGIPRVRVIIQQEAAEPDPSRNWVDGGQSGFSTPPPGHARILLVMRDRGQDEEIRSPDPADSWIKTPTLV
jgi:hypothetical protein